jgi:hypothetical protein
MDGDHALCPNFQPWSPVSGLLSATGRRERATQPLMDNEIANGSRPGFALQFNKGEVQDAFEVPLAFLMTPENHKRESRNWNGLTISLYSMPFGQRNIWGATAAIIRNLYERVQRG